MVESPCYECKDRTVEPNCHAECEKYKAYRAKIEKRNKTRRDANAFVNAKQSQKNIKVKQRKYTNYGGFGQ